MQSTAEYFAALRDFSRRSGELMDEIRPSVEKHILGWRPIYGDLSDLQACLNNFLEDFSEEEEDSPSDTLDGFLRATENWWNSIQVKITEREAAVAAARRAMQ